MFVKKINLFFPTGGQGGKVINIGSLTNGLARATGAPYPVTKGDIKH